jgi:hypothetical protein
MMSNKERYLNIKGKPGKTREELKQLAQDIIDNKVFCDAHIPLEDAGLLPNIFIPIALGGLSKLSEEEKSNLGMFFEYYDEGGPSAINGFPMFFSMQILSKEEAKPVKEIVSKYLSKREELLEEAMNAAD